MTDDEAKRYKAKLIDKMYPDPVKRREAHEYQNHLNEMLDGLVPEDRVFVIMKMMNQNIQKLEDLLQGLKDEFQQ